MPYSFGENSERKLKMCHPDLVKILKAAIQVTNVDFGISDTLRSDEDQLKYFLEGKSRIDPRDKELRLKSKHLADEQGYARAADLFCFVKGSPSLMYDTEHLSYIMGVIHTVTEILYSAGEITHKIRWGGNWDMDGCIVKDQGFDDLPHIELYKVN